MKILSILRSLVFVILQIVSAIIISLVGFLFWFASDKFRYNYLKLWTSFTMVSLRVICGVKHEVFGQENLDLTQTGLILARHESTWETFAFQLIFPRVAFVLKQELLFIPFFGWGLAMMSPIAIHRSGGRKAIKLVLEEGIKRLKSDCWVVIFPEGTRMPLGKIGKINSGGAFLAKKSAAKTYLVAHNAGNCWPGKGWIITPGTVKVFISKPIDASAMDIKELNKLTEEWFTKNHAEEVAN